jgi:hypothetical protein
MAVIEIRERGPEVTQRQRYSHYFAIAFGIIGFIIGINLRDSTLLATTQYADTRAGIRAFYPENWLIDTTSDEYVFRVRDMTQPGFKTTIQVSMYPVSAQSTIRNVVESLALTRMQTLANYSMGAVEPYFLEDQPEAFVVEYAFSTADSDPFLEAVPSVVRGQDIMTLKRGQAVVITFRSDANTYEQNLRVFEQFLDDLEF